MIALLTWERLALRRARQGSVNGLGYDDFSDKIIATLSQPPALVKAHAELDRALDLCYHPQPFTSTRQRVENDRRAASAEAAALGSVETLHLSQVFTGGPQSNGHAMVFGVAPNPALGG